MKGKNVVYAAMASGLVVVSVGLYCPQIKKSSNVLLNNIEALADSGESDSSYNCVDLGSVDCPYRENLKTMSVYEYSLDYEY